MDNQIVKKQSVLSQPTISSREIASFSGKRHSDVIRSIESMQPVWEKVNGRNFALVDYLDKKGEKRKEYRLTKTECLFVTSKFNDEMRAKLILRWEELEKEASKPRIPAGQYFFEKLMKENGIPVNITNGIKRWAVSPFCTRALGYKKYNLLPKSLKAMEKVSGQTAIIRVGTQKQVFADEYALCTLLKNSRRTQAKTLLHMLSPSNLLAA